MVKPPRKRVANKPSSERPQRTREHVLADLSTNYVARFILREGHTEELVHADYGYDLTISTYDSDGGLENGVIYVQLKAADKIKALRDGETISLSLERKHVVLWRDEVMPVILILYDAAGDRAYWLHVQPYFRVPGFLLRAEQNEVTVHLSQRNVVNEQAVKTFRRLKNEVVQRARKATLDE